MSYYNKQGVRCTCGNVYHKKLYNNEEWYNKHIETLTHIEAQQSYMYESLKDDVYFHNATGGDPKKVPIEHRLEYLKKNSPWFGW